MRIIGGDQGTRRLSQPHAAQQRHAADESPTYDLRMRTDEEIGQGNGRRIFVGILLPAAPVSPIGPGGDLGGSGGNVQHHYTPTAYTVTYLLRLRVTHTDSAKLTALTAAPICDGVTVHLTHKSGRLCPAESWLAGELAEVIPCDLRSEWRGGHGAETLGPRHPGFGLRADEANQQHPPLTQLLHVKYVSGLGCRNHHASFLVGRGYRHGGIIPQVP
jgi:hypothetical protein